MAEGVDLLPVSERFAGNLSRFREAAGSPRRTSFAAEIHGTQVSFIECGHRMPRLDTLVKLASALGVTVDDLLDAVTWEPSVQRPEAFRVSFGEGGDG